MSLPSRERGLKYHNFLLLAVPTESLPSRERELKFGGLGVLRRI